MKEGEMGMIIVGVISFVAGVIFGVVVSVLAYSRSSNSSVVTSTCPCCKPWPKMEVTS